ncbi:MAG: hypothetical protein QM729_07600 [Solirubrobacterales bacterium]
MARLFARGTDDRSARRRWTDRAIGILVGVVIGLGVLVYFVFVHSEGTIDAPKVNGAESGQTTGAGNGSGGSPAGEGSRSGSPGESSEGAEKSGSGSQKKGETVPVVKVVGGAPPTGAGPEQLHFKKGEKVRFEIETDEPFSFEIKGLGIAESLEESSIISFKAKKAGQFPVIATATLIGVADLLIKK